MSGELKLDGMFPSYEALIQAAQGPAELKQDERSSRDTDRNHWFGNKTWTEAVDTATHGDIKGAEALRPEIIAGANKMRMELGRLDPVYRLDEGRWIDVARYVKGEPECWGDMVATEERTARKSVSVVLNTCVGCQISAEQINRVAVALGSGVLGLQSAGYTVALYLAVVNNGYRRVGPWIVGAPVNQSGQPLDIARLSAILRPWFFRRIIFSIWETASASQREKFGIYSGGGYGQVGHLQTKDVQRITGDKNAIVIDVDRYLGNEGGIKDALIRAMGAKGAQ